MAKKKNNICIVKQSEDIRRALLKKFSQPDHIQTFSSIIEEAAEYGITIAKASLSKYLSKPFPVKGGLIQEHILFLCLKNGIDVNLVIADDPKTAAKKFAMVWRKKAKQL